MNEDDTQKTIMELKERIAHLEAQLAQKKADDLQTPAQAEQERFQQTVESFNRDKELKTLNSHPDTKPDGK